jgi:hypothetical protein
LRRALLDVNVLVALLDRQHVAHVRAHTWLAQNIEAGLGEDCQTSWIRNSPGEST